MLWHDRIFSAYRSCPSIHKVGTVRMSYGWKSTGCKEGVIKDEAQGVAVDGMRTCTPESCLPCALASDTTCRHRAGRTR